MRNKDIRKTKFSRFLSLSLSISFWMCYFCCWCCCFAVVVDDEVVAQFYSIFALGCLGRAFHWSPSHRKQNRNKKLLIIDFVELSQPMNKKYAKKVERCVRSVKSSFLSPFPLCCVKNPPSKVQRPEIIREKVYARIKVPPFSMSPEMPPKQLLFHSGCTVKKRD